MISSTAYPLPYTSQGQPPILLIPTFPFLSSMKPIPCGKKSIRLIYNFLPFSPAMKLQSLPSFNVIVVRSIKPHRLKSNMPRGKAVPIRQRRVLREECQKNQREHSVAPI